MARQEKKDNPNREWQPSRIGGPRGGISNSGDDNDSMMEHMRVKGGHIDAATSDGAPAKNAGNEA